MKTTRVAVFFAALSSAMICTAHAGQIDPSAFSPSEKTEVSFSSLPLDFGRPGPLIADGVTFTSGAGWLRTYPATNPFPGGPTVQVCAENGCIMTNSEFDYFTVSLPQPVALVGAYLGIPNTSTTATAEFYSGTSLLGSVNISATAFEGVFAGWNAGSAEISSVKFIDTQNQGFVLGLTGFTYQVSSVVPEASTGSQALVGLFFLVFSLRARGRNA